VDALTQDQVALRGNTTEVPHLLHFPLRLPLYDKILFIILQKKEDSILLIFTTFVKND
jgi:hypothetical protein